MAQITRKVTFDADGAPNPRIIAVGMQGDNNARMLLLNLPSITENQNVYVNVENGEHADTIRLYQNEDGLWGWSISANSMAVFGNGTAQVKIIDPGDPLDIKWQSGKMQLSLGASMDTDSTISERNITLLEQIQEELQTAEESIASSAASVNASVNYARGYAEDADTAYQGAVTARESSEYHADRSEEAAQSASDIADTLAQAAAEAIRTANEAAARAEAAADEATEIAIDKSIDSRYVHSADFTGRKIVSKIADADGSGSGLDADLLDGKEASYFEDISNIQSGALSAEHGGTGLENPDAGYVLEGGGENSALQLRHISTEAPASGSGDLITSGITYAALQGKADIAQTFTGTLLASGWANGIQTLSNSAITAESIVRLALADSITAQQQNQAAYARIRLTGQTAGAITVAADGTIPSVNIPIKIIIEGVNGTAVGATIGEYITEIEGIDQRVTTIEGTLPGKWARINTNTDAATQNQLDINEKINGIELPIEVAWTVGNLSCTSGQAPVADSDPTYMHSSVITVTSGNTYVDAAHAIHGLHVTLMSDWTVDFVKVYDSEGDYVYERHSGFNGVEAYAGAGAYMLLLYKGGQDISSLDADRYVQIYETTTLSADALIYRGKVTSYGNSFEGCIRPGWYAFTYSEISGGYITDAPSDLNNAGTMIVINRTAAGTLEAAYIYRIIIAQTGEMWLKRGANNWQAINPFAETMRYIGTVRSQGSAFSDCAKTGYYSFTNSHITQGYISDPPSNLNQGGQLIVYNKCADGSSIYQYIRDHSGNEWRRKIESDWTQTINVNNDFDALNSAVQQNTNTIGYSTLDSYAETNGNYNSTGKWNYINENYRHILIDIEEGDVIKLTAGSAQLNYGILAQPTTPTNGQDADSAPITGYTGIKSLAAGGTITITAPETATTLLIMSTYNGSSRNDYGVTLNGLNYNKNIAKNLAEIGTDLSGVITDAVSRETLVNGIIDQQPVWQRGTIPTSGTNRNSSSSTRFRTQNMLHCDTDIILKVNAEENKYDTLLILFTKSIDESTQEEVYTVQTSFGYDLKTKLIPAGSYFRIVLQLHADPTQTLPTTDLPYVNDYVYLIDDALIKVIKPDIRWIAMGDSITAGYVSTGESSTRNSQILCWAGQVAHIRGWNLNNIGHGGTGWVTNANSDASVWPQSATNAWYKATDPNKGFSFADYDLVTLAYGINDYKSGKAIGTIEAEDGTDYPETIIGGMQKTIEAIIAENPTIKIIVILPINCMGYKTGETLGTEATNYAIGYSYTGCGTLKQVHDAMISVCEYYGIEYIDMTMQSAVNRKNISTMLLDGVHPSQDAHLQLARELASKINFGH